MADTTLDPRFGNPTPDSTHWQIHRLGTGSDPPLQHPDGEGVMSTRWRISELSMATIRERWGNGRYYVRWYTASGDGNRTRGKSPEFELRNAAEEEPAQPAPTDDFSRFQAMQRQAREEARAETDRVMALVMQFGGRPAVAVASPESEELRAMRVELQEMRTREAARTAADAVRAELRADLDASNRRIAELERESERAEDDGPSLDLESPIMGQIVNLAVNAALKNPDLVTGLLGTVMQKIAEGKAPPTPNPPPPQVQAGTPNVSRETFPAPQGRVVVVPFPKRPDVAPAAAPAVVVEDFPYGKPEPIPKPGNGVSATTAPAESS